MARLLVSNDLEICPLLKCLWENFDNRSLNAS